MSNKNNSFARPVVVMDMDGVVADFWFSASSVLNMLFNIPVYPVSTFEAKDWGTEWLGITKEQENHMWDEIRKARHTLTRDFWAQERELYSGIVERVANVASASGFTWYWCTTRDDLASNNAQSQSIEFLENNGFSNPCVVVSGEKGAFCKSVAATYFVDDKYANCVKVKDACPETNVYFVCLRGQAENEQKAKDRGMRVVYNTDGFLDEFCHLHGLPVNLNDE